MEVSIAIYNKSFSEDWNKFIKSSKNGTFLSNRHFLKYHKDRISDFSLIFLIKNKVCALLPANRIENTLFSHSGLTYGGLILDHTVTTSMVLDIFESLIVFLREEGFDKIVYKSVPHIYHKYPAEEDLYALFKLNAKLIARSVSSCLPPATAEIAYSELRRRGIKKAEKAGLTIKEEQNFASFWKILEDNLFERYEAKPVHTLAEIEYLKSSFPKEIRLFEVIDNDSVIAGCVTFETERVIHAQYISASPLGKASGALDMLFDHLIKRANSENKYFDFGTSTESGGQYLNKGLISQKEGFGARAVVYDTYEIQF